MTDIKKIRKTASALFAVAGLVLLWFIVDTLRGFILNIAQWHSAGIVMTIIGMLIVLAMLTVALILLFSTRREETPFNMKNVRRLRIIAILLAVLEPYLFISERIFSRLYPIVLSGNVTVSVHVSLGGCIFAAGLVVYCVSLVFEYGISLQQQVDETL